MNWTLIEIHTDYCLYEFIYHGRKKFYHVPLLTSQQMIIETKGEYKP